MQLKLVEVLALLLTVIVLAVGSFYLGMSYKDALNVAEVAKVQQAIQDTSKVMREVAADAISKITVRNTTIQGKVETIVRDNPVYRDCVNDASVVRNINEVLTGRTGLVSDSSVSTLDGTKR